MVLATSLPIDSQALSLSLTSHAEPFIFGCNLCPGDSASPIAIYFLLNAPTLYFLSYAIYIRVLFPGGF